MAHAAVTCAGRGRCRRPPVLPRSRRHTSFQPARSIFRRSSLPRWDCPSLSTNRATTS